MMGRAPLPGPITPPHPRETTVPEPGAPTSVKGLSLVEIVGRDVLSWRLVTDPRPSHVAVVDSPRVAGLCIVDEAAEITAIQTAQNTWRTVYSFETQSALYSMIYWRRGYVEEQAGHYTLRDSWQAVEPRVFLFAFPPYTVLEALRPPPLQTSLTAWEGLLFASALGTEITTEATYQMDPDRSARQAVRAGAPPSLPTLVGLLPPTPGLPTLINRVRSLCKARDLLAGSRLIRHILGL
jgi:hypothetical protein